MSILKYLGGLAFVLSVFCAAFAAMAHRRIREDKKRRRLREEWELRRESRPPVVYYSD